VSSIDKFLNHVFAAAQHLRTLLSLILTNSEARKLLSDFSLIGRDLLARTASMAADAIKPDEEKLARADDTAPQDQFVEDADINRDAHKLKDRVAGAKDSVQQEAKAFVGAAYLVVDSINSGD
jgi:hypothetical protein